MIPSTTPESAAAMLLHISEDSKSADPLQLSPLLVRMEPRQPTGLVDTGEQPRDVHPPDSSGGIDMPPPASSAKPSMPGDADAQRAASGTRSLLQSPLPRRGGRSSSPRLRDRSTAALASGVRLQTGQAQPQTVLDLIRYRLPRALGPSCPMVSADAAEGGVRAESGPTRWWRSRRPLRWVTCRCRCRPTDALMPSTDVAHGASGTDRAFTATAED